MGCFLFVFFRLFVGLVVFKGFSIFDFDVFFIRKIIVMVQKTVSVMLEKTREEAEVVLEEMTTDELVLSNAVSETLLDHRLDG